MAVSLRLVLLGFAMTLVATAARAQTCTCRQPEDQRGAIRALTAIYEAIPLKAEAQNGDEIEPGQMAVRGELEVITFKITGIWQGAPAKSLRVLNQLGNCALGLRLNQKALIVVFPIMPGEIRATPALRELKVGWSTDFCAVDFVNKVQAAGKLGEYLGRSAPADPP